MEMIIEKPPRPGVTMKLTAEEATMLRVFFGELCADLVKQTMASASEGPGLHAATYALTAQIYDRLESNDY